MQQLATVHPYACMVPNELYLHNLNNKINQPTGSSGSQWKYDK